jgi:hypothetical protein
MGGTLNTVLGEFMKITVLWNITTFSLVDIYQRL